MFIVTHDMYFKTPEVYVKCGEHLKITPYVD